MDIFLYQDISTNKSMVQCANSLCPLIIRIVSIHGCNLLPVRLEPVTIRSNLRTTLYLILSFNGCSVLLSKAVCSLNPSVQNFHLPCPPGRYYRESVTPNIGIICILYRINTRFHGFNNVALVCNKYYVLLCILLGVSPASDCCMPTFRNPLSVASSRAGCTVWEVSGGRTIYIPGLRFAGAGRTNEERGVR